MNLNEYADRDMLAMNVANVLAGALEEALLTHDRVSFAVPGGSTPGPIFDLLSGTELDWSRVHVMLTDERWVPEDHEMSNTALVKSRLLTGYAADATFIPFYRPGLSAAEGCAAVSESLAQHFPISVLMLGMGSDMHTASLFPGGDGLARAMATEAPALNPMRVPGQSVERVTLSSYRLNGAMAKHLVITGEDKRAALARAQGLSYDEAPIMAVLDGADIHWAA